jgi:hypothetical protein
MPMHAVLTVEAAFDKVGVLFAGPTRPDEHAEINVSLHVRNHGNDAIPFTFMTTQRFEIELLNGDGEVVSRWSDGQVFGEVITTEELAPRQTWTYHGLLQIPVGSGGDHAVRIYLTADKRPGAQSPLHITLAP